MTHLLKNNDHWYDELDLRKLVELVLIDLKMHLRQLNMTFVAKSWSPIAFSSKNERGYDPIFLIESNLLGLIVMNYHLRK